MNKCVNCGRHITNQSGVCRNCLIKQPDWYQNMDEESRRKYNKNEKLNRYWGRIGIFIIFIGVLSFIFGVDNLMSIVLIIIGLAIFAFL